MRRRKAKKYSKLDSILELPREVTSSDVKLTLNGFDEILIENYKNILEYQDILIKVNTFEGAISIYGFNLRLEQMTDEDIKIIGQIDNIEFEKLTD